MKEEKSVTDINKVTIEEIIHKQELEVKNKEKLINLNKVYQVTVQVIN